MSRKLSWLMLSRLCGAVLTAAVLAGCAGDYQNAAAGFHKAAQDTVTAISESNDVVARLSMEARRDLAIEVPSRLSIPAGHCTAEKPLGCDLQFRKEQGSQPEPLSASRAPFHNTLALARAIEAYAAGLQAIAEADTAGQARAAAAQASGAVQSLAATAASIGNKATTPPELALAQPIGAAAGWIFGEYVSARKLADLRAVTAQAEGSDSATGPLAEATDLFADALALSERALLVTMSEQTSAAKAAFIDKPSEKTYSAFVASANAMDNLIKAKASDIPSKLKQAHTDLYKALQADKIESLDDFFATVQQISAKAAELKNIVEGLLAALDASKEPSS